MKNNQFVSKNSHFVVKYFFSNAQQINTRDIVTVCARSTTIIHHLCGVLKTDCF
jgi:phosphomevalonate kinase